MAKVLRALPRQVQEVATFQALPVPPPEYLESAMARLRNSFLVRKVAPITLAPRPRAEAAEVQKAKRRVLDIDVPPLADVLKGRAEIALLVRVAAEPGGALQRSEAVLRRLR